MPEVMMNVDRQFQKVISDAARSKANPAQSSSDLIRRAIALYTFLHEKVDNAPGTKVGIVNEAGEIILLIDDLP